jgi:hypothetical protein
MAENETTLKCETAPDDFDFDRLRWMAIQILSEHSLATIAGLVRVASIKRDDDYVQTACIGRRGSRLEIRFNGNFVYTYARKPVEFAGLIAHEIFHEILGHLNFSKYKGNMKAWNIAQDCIIQSTLSNMNKPPSKTGSSYAVLDSRGDYLTTRYTPIPSEGFNITALMERMYKLEGIEALLRPPNYLKRISRKETTGDYELDSIRRKLYPEKGTSQVNETDIYKFILRKFSDEIEDVVLIGMPSGEPSEDNEAENKIEYKEGAGNILDDSKVIKICEEVDKVAGGPGKLTNQIMKVIKTKNKQLESALDAALIDNVKAKIVAGVGVLPRASRSVVLSSSITRSDLIKLSAGYYPVFFGRKISDVKKVRVNVYIDVSYSCSNYIPWMYGCILDLTRIADVNCFLFSTSVIPISLKEIEKGTVSTYGGTSFDCIVEHSILPRNIKEVSKAVIFTDGYADISQHNIDLVKDKGIQYIGALISHYHKDNYKEDALNKFCTKVYKVPYMGGK